jgi:hypothetical protein
MGVRNTGGMTPLSDIPSGAKRSKVMESHADADIEMEHGNGQRNSYTGNYNDRSGYAVGVMSDSPSGDNRGEVYLRGVDAESKNGGIYKSTNVTVSHV